MKEQYSRQIRDAFKKTLGEMYPDRESLRDVATELGISYESARQARDYGKGSVETLAGLVMYGFKIPPASFPKNFPKVFKALEKSSDLVTLEKLLEEALSKYGRNEIIAWLRLLNARYEIEFELGIRKRAGRSQRKD